MMPFSAFRTACLPLIAAVAVACGGGGGGGGAAPDNTAPTVTIHFPPPTSMTEGSTVIMRGTATDRSDITSLQINGTEVEDTSDDGSYATWSVVVELATGANTLTASVEDSAGNRDTDAASVSVLRDDTPTDFPNADAPVYLAEYIAVNPASNMAYISNNFGDDDIIRVNLATGARDVFSAEGVGSDRITGIFYDSSSSRLWVTQEGAEFLFEVNTSSGARVDSDVDFEIFDFEIFGNASSLIENPSVSDQLIALSCNLILSLNILSGEYSVLQETNPSTDVTPLGCMKGVIISDGNYIVTREDGTDEAAVLSVGISSGARLILSSNSDPNADAPLFEAPHSIIHDSERSRFIVSDTDAGTLIAVHEDTGVRSPFSGDGDNGLLEAKGMYFDSASGVIYVAVSYGLAAVDIESGDIVILAHSHEPV